MNTSHNNIILLSKKKKNVATFYIILNKTDWFNKEN